MKRNIKISIFAIAIITIVSIVSCSKDEIQNNNTGNTRLNEIKLVNLGSNEKGDITMLEFRDVNTYEETMISLQKSLKEHDYTFTSKYGHLGEEEINEKEKEIGFVWQQPLIDFEKMMNFTNSMRKAFFIAEDLWLKNEELDEKTNPRNEYPFNFAEMTLLNNNGEVKIGDSIIKFTKLGFIMITDGNIKTLNRINSGDMTALKDANVVTSIEEYKGDDCTNWKGYNQYDPYATNKKVNRSVQFHSYPWKGCTQSEITSYKKSYGVWLRYRISMSISSDNQLYTTNCDSIVKKGWINWDNEYSSYVDVNYASWDAYPQYRAKKSMSVLGGYKYSGRTNYLTLTW